MRILKPGKGRKAHIVDYAGYTHKVCSKCGQTKPIEEFGKTTAETRIGWAWRSWCRDCDKARCKIYGVGNKPKRNARLKQWRKDNPDKARVLDRKRMLKHKYGLTVAAADALFSAASGRCEVCGGVSKLCIDHCHTTGRVRGILCASCNTFLGRIENNSGLLTRLEAYLNERCHK
jgi:hypothetical protein